MDSRILKFGQLEPCTRPARELTLLDKKLSTDHQGGVSNSLALAS